VHAKSSPTLFTINLSCGTQPTRASRLTSPTPRSVCAWDGLVPAAPYDPGAHGDPLLAEASAAHLNRETARKEPGWGRGRNAVASAEYGEVIAEGVVVPNAVVAGAADGVVVKPAFAVVT
jgi:hypothetical protein